MRATAWDCWQNRLQRILRPSTIDRGTVPEGSQDDIPYADTRATEATAFVTEVRTKDEDQP